MGGLGLKSDLHHPARALAGVHCGEVAVAQGAEVGEGGEGLFRQRGAAGGAFGFEPEADGFDLAVNTGADLGGGDVAGLRALLLPLLAPLLLEPFELPGVDRAQAFGLALGKAFGRAVAQDEHQQPIIVVAAGADLLALPEDRIFGAIERAVHRGVLDPGNAAIERGLPGAAEAGSFGVIAQHIDLMLAHAHPATGGSHRAGFGEQRDEFALARRAPSALAHALARNGGEIERIVGIGGGEGREIGHREGGSTKPPSRKM